MKTIVRILVVLLLLVLLMLFVPSSIPLVIADEAVYPVYTPVRPTAEAVETIPFDAATPYAPHSGAYDEKNWNYSDPSIVVHTEMMRAYNTDIMLTWVTISDASQIRAKLAKDKIAGNGLAFVDVMAKDMQAVLAINGDNCKDTKYKNSGYIVRNGELLRSKPSKFDALIIDDKGDLHIVTEPTPEKMEAFEGTILHSFNFGPALIIDGEPVDVAHLNANASCAPTKKAQRICIGQLDELSYLIIACEGPENRNSQGMKLSQFLDVVSHFDLKVAYNLDGGSSATIAMNYRKINARSTGKKRSVSDAICFISAVPENENGGSND